MSDQKNTKPENPGDYFSLEPTRPDVVCPACLTPNEPEGTTHYNPEQNEDSFQQQLKFS